MKKINPDSVVMGEREGRDPPFPADSVIVSVGYVPAPLIKSAPHVHLVGDANGVGNLRTVVWRAWQVAIKL